MITNAKLLAQLRKLVGLAPTVPTVPVAPTVPEVIVGLLASHITIEVVIKATTEDELLRQLLGVHNRYLGNNSKALEMSHETPTCSWAVRYTPLSKDVK